MPANAPEVIGYLHRDHVALIRNLDRLRSIADALDDATPESVTALITEANAVVLTREALSAAQKFSRMGMVFRHEPAHREILRLARLLARVVEDLPSEKIDRYLVRDAQRVIEAIEALVRIHTAQEEDTTTPPWHGRRCRRRRRAGQCRQAAQSDVCRVKGAARESANARYGHLRSLLSAESDRPWRYTGPPPFLSGRHHQLRDCASRAAKRKACGIHFRQSVRRVGGREERSAKVRRSFCLCDGVAATHEPPSRRRFALH